MQKATPLIIEKIEPLVIIIRYSSWASTARKEHGFFLRMEMDSQAVERMEGRGGGGGGSGSQL